MRVIAVLRQETTKNEPKKSKNLFALHQLLKLFVGHQLERLALGRLGALYDVIVDAVYDDRQRRAVFFQHDVVAFQENFHAVVIFHLQGLIFFLCEILLFDGLFLLNDGHPRGQVEKPRLALVVLARVFVVGKFFGHVTVLFLVRGLELRLQIIEQVLVSVLFHSHERGGPSLRVNPLVVVSHVHDAEVDALHDLLLNFDGLL